MWGFSWAKIGRKRLDMFISIFSLSNTKFYFHFLRKPGFRSAMNWINEANSNFDCLFNFIQNFKPDSMINMKTKCIKFLMRLCCYITRNTKGQVFGFEVSLSQAWLDPCSSFHYFRSLFSNVPPTINFMLHNETSAHQLPDDIRWHGCIWPDPLEFVRDGYKQA